MRNMKKIWCALFAAVLAAGMVFTAGVAYATGSKADGIGGIGKYKVISTSSKTLRLYGLTDKGKSQKTIRIGKSIDATGKNKGTYNVTEVAKNAFDGAKATTIRLPSTVKKISSGAFAGQKAKSLTVYINSKKLTKKVVKGCFKGTKAKKITVKVPKSKLTTYKKIFTKSNTGAKCKVIVKKK
jgi:hypothetical protein